MAIVIEFPKKNMRQVGSEQGGPSKDQIEESVETMKFVHVNETLMALIPMIFERLYAAGFDYPETSPEYITHIEFLIETLHSLMLRKYDISHPFQTMADNIFTLDSDGDLTLVEHLEIDFHPNNDDPVVAANT
jgi:hypothetical protein